MIKPRRDVKAKMWVVNQQLEKQIVVEEQKPLLIRTQKRRLQRRRIKEKIRGIMAMLEQSKKIEKELVRGSRQLSYPGIWTKCFSSPLNSLKRMNIKKIC